MPCVGALLVQPQRLERPKASDSLDALADDVLRLTTRLADDLVRGGVLLREIGEAFEDSGLRFHTNAGPGLARAETRLKAWLGEVIEGASGMVEGLPDGIDGGAELLTRILDGFVVVAELDADRLRPHVELVTSVIEDDLGLTPTFLTDQLWAVVDDLIRRLDTMPDGLDDDTRAAWIECRAILRRVRRRLKADFVLPWLSVERIVAEILALLRRSPLPHVAAQAACLGSGLQSGLRGTNRLLTLVPPSGFSIRSLGAAAAAPTVDAQYCWYASWLLGAKKRPEWWQFGRIGRAFKEGFGEAFEERNWYSYLLYVLWDPLEGLGNSIGKLGRTDEVWIEKDRTRVRWGDHVLYRGENVTWQDALAYSSDPRPVMACRDRVPPCPTEPQDEVLLNFRGYTFGKTFLGIHLTQDTMEGFARHSAWMRDYTVALLHLLPEFSLRKGDYWANVANATVLAADGSFKLGTKAPLGWWLDNVGELRGEFEWILGKPPWPVIATVVGSLEGMHTNPTAWNWFMFQLTQTLSDGVKTLTYRSMVDTVRDGLLSLFTLWNYDGERALEPSLSAHANPYWDATVEDHRPDNRKEIDGVADLGVLLFTYLLVKAVPREEYIHWFEDGETTAKHFLLYELLAGAAMGMAGGFVGCVFAEILAWAEDWSLLGKKMLQSVWAVWKGYWPALYGFKEGDTDDGKYHPRGTAYRGYPDHTSSPYRLPYRAGDARVIGQGNQGIWSHNNVAFTSQVYAYDFGLDESEPVLAARPGTVVDWFDAVPNDSDTNTTAAAVTPGQTTNSSNNFIVIRHDRDETGALVVANPPNAVHDRGAGGASVWTYGVYLHGRTGSVQATFGGAPGAIIGQAVTRGQQIMLAGDTGKSFHNHLHMHVLPGPAPLQNTFTGDGVQAAFVFTFNVGAATLTVIVNGVVLVNGADYAVGPPPPPPAGAPVPPGGTVTFTVAPAAGATIVITRIGAVSRGSLVNSSIPFVFCEVTNPSPFAPDGVCLARTYYTSANDGSAC